MKKKLKVTAAVASILAVGVVTMGLTHDKREYEVIKGLDIFFALFRTVNTFYVDEFEPKTVLRNGIDAMLESLDPYTNFIDEKDMEDFKLMTTGEYGGVGAIISKSDTDYIMVRELYKGLPADEAGLIPGDRILSINGLDMQGKKVSDVSSNLRGTPGTDAKLKIYRPSTNETFETTAKRRVIQLNPVNYYGMIDNEIGYIELSSFTQGCAQEVKKALVDLKSKGCKKLVLDLRANPGGILDDAIDMVGLFVPKKSLVLTTRGRYASQTRYHYTTADPIDTVMPITVLISRGSASASEIVTGALQDLDRAVVIGQRSFGKGLVQSTRPLEHNTYVKVTTAKYYIPSGRCIQALDYTHRDKDGAVGYVPDSLIHEFHTKGGRAVYDGGGVSPDIHVDIDTATNIVYSLIYSDVIFHYAVAYRHNHKEIAAVKDFVFTDEDYADFCKFVATRKNFTYKNKTTEALKKLVSAAKSDKYYEDNKQLFEKLNKTLEPDLQKDLQTSKEEIKKYITSEILTSYYFRAGQIEFAITRDDDVDAALKVLRDEQRFYGILSGKVASHAGDKRLSNSKK